MDPIRARTGPYRVTALHFGDLQVAALTCKDSEEILKDLQANPGIVVVDQPEPGHHYDDLAIHFMYPSNYKRHKEERLKAAEAAKKS